MNFLDLLIVVAALGAGVVGYRLGFVTRVISWVFLGVGLYVAARFLPSLARSADQSATSQQVLLLSLLILAGGAFIGQAIGLAIGSRLNRTLPRGTVRRADSAVGSVAGVAGVLLLVWFITPAMSSVPGWTAQEARESRIARGVDRLFPTPPDSAQSLQQLVGERYPQVFDRLRPAPDLGRPPASSGLSEATVDRVASSTVKVIGRACGRIQEGSGFVVAPGLVLTNAHVVAGDRGTFVERFDDRRQVDAEVVAFDKDRDVAVLSVPDLDRPALLLSDPAVGDVGAVLGHPGGRDLEASPFEVADSVTVTGFDIYDGARTRREVLYLSADLERGDSGGALVDPDGEVIGMAFAIAPDKPGVAYALSVSELRPVLDSVEGDPVATGDCIAA